MRVSKALDASVERMVWVAVNVHLVEEKSSDPLSGFLGNRKRTLSGLDNSPVFCYCTAIFEI